MGRDKALLPFGDSKTLTEYQLNRTKDWFENVYISCKSKGKFDFDGSFIEDTEEFEAYSALVALYSILNKLKTPVAVLSVDTPFVTYEIYEALYTNSKNHEATIAKSPFGSHQMCAIYKPTILPILREQIKDNNHKIKKLLEKIKSTYVNFDKDTPFTNLNRYDEYDKARLFYNRSANKLGIQKTT